ncbi:MAG: hypothetical protein Q9191_000602 [Dirinaria sp. TL-2023a]
MADPAKSKPTWSFGATGSMGNPGDTNNLFGQKSLNTSSPGSSQSTLFGGPSNTQQGPSPFGGGGGGSSSTNQGSLLFGGGSKENQGISSFGGGSNTQSSPIFGGGAGAGNNAGAGNPFAGLSFGQNKQQPPTSASNQTSNIFGGVAKTGGSTLFGNAGGSTSSAPTSGAQTPTSKPTGGYSFGGPSTTPAGPPPANALSFGIQKPQENIGGGFLLGQPKSSEQDKASVTAPSSNLFSSAKSSSGFLQTSQPSEFGAKASTSASNPSIFSNVSGGNLFGDRPEAQPTAGLFNNLGKANVLKTSSEPAVSAPQQSQPEATPSLFTNIGGQSATPGMSGQSGAPSLFSPKPQATDTQKPGLTFGDSKEKLAESSTPNNSAPSLFGGQKSSAATPTASAPAPSGSSSNTFANLGKAPERASEPKGSTTTATAPSLASAPPLSLGSPGIKPAATASTNTATNATSSNAANLGSSTAGPPPAPQSRLKNKSMDEIITRWASDLSKYQKEFQKQAEKIAGWDRALVENSDKIQKLYGSTLEAQRATSEVERQLTVVENEQDELEHYLDIYEKQVIDMMQNHGGQEGSLQGPDKERRET